MLTYTLKIVEIRKETDEAVTLCFKQPALRKVKYSAGQYLTLIFRINGRRYIRPYSFSSCPLVDDMIEVTIKRVLNGIVSNHIIDKVKTGDVIEALSPMGDFVHNSDKGVNHVYLWGVGSGITPLISIAKQVLFNESETKIHLIYGNRNNETVIFYEKLQSLNERYKSRFTITYFYTKLGVDLRHPNVVLGRIDQSKAAEILNQNYDVAKSCHYICGPVGLKESVKRALNLYRVNEDNVFSEDFELLKDPKDFEEIDTKVIDLEFEGRNHSVEVAKGKSILEAALDANIELPYSCQTGNCSTCKGKLFSGNVKMIGLTKERTDLGVNEFLLCCTHPLTDGVQIVIK